MFEAVKEVYRQKRIRRILRFYSHLQSYGTVFVQGVPVDLRTKSKKVLVSRDALIHFCFTLLALMILGSAVSRALRGLSLGGGLAVPLLSSLTCSFLAVELADWVVEKLGPSLDLLFDYVLPLLALVTGVTVFFGLWYFDLGPTWASRFSAWRDSVNQRIQSRPVTLAIVPEEGRNWFFVRDTSGALLPLTRQEAEAECQSYGGHWQLFDAEPGFQADPAPTLGGSVSVWMGQGFPVGQLNAGTGLGRPSVFRSAQKTDRVVTLCISREDP